MTYLTKPYPYTNCAQMWLLVLKFVAVPPYRLIESEKKTRCHKFFPELLADCSVFEVRAWPLFRFWNLCLRNSFGQATEQISIVELSENLTRQKRRGSGPKVGLISYGINLYGNCRGKAYVLCVCMSFTALLPKWYFSVKSSVLILPLNTALHINFLM
jgi:hypothetical protein